MVEALSLEPSFSRYIPALTSQAKLILKIWVTIKPLIIARNDVSMSFIFEKSLMRGFLMRPLHLFCQKFIVAASKTNIVNNNDQ
jgi:hypothetical protein